MDRAGVCLCTDVFVKVCTFVSVHVPVYECVCVCVFVCTPHPRGSFSLGQTVIIGSMLSHVWCFQMRAANTFCWPESYCVCARVCVCVYVCLLERETEGIWNDEQKCLCAYFVHVCVCGKVCRNARVCVCVCVCVAYFSYQNTQHIPSLKHADLIHGGGLINSLQVMSVELLSKTAILENNFAIWVHCTLFKRGDCLCSLRITSHRAT